jgi:hypothetical protein
MTREELIRMAREAEIDELMQMMPRVSQKIERFAAIVAAAEREACAKFIDDFGPTLANGAMLAEAIRARGQA